jgi:hypothetical protein
MNTYILIIILNIYGMGGRAAGVTSVEFNSLETCTYASKTLGSTTNYTVLGACFKK